MHLGCKLLVERHPQKHLRCTMVGPDSSYSPLEIHICWNVLKDDRIDPPIHTEYLRSGGATTLIFIVEGAKAVSSLVMRSPMPDGLESRVVDSSGLLADEARLEEHLWATEALAANSDDISVWQFVGFLLIGTLRGNLHFRVVVQCDVRELLLHVAHDLALRGGGEGVATLSQNLHHVLSKVSASQVHPC